MNDFNDGAIIYEQLLSCLACICIGILAYHCVLLQWPASCVACSQERYQLLLLPQLLVLQCLDQLAHPLLVLCKAR